MKKYILILSVIFGIGVNAQIAKSTFEYPLVKSTTSKEFLLPKIDVKALLQQDSVEAEKGKRYAPRFAYAHEVNANTLNSGEWKNISNGKLWQIHFKAQHNYSLGVIFNEFDIPNGAYVYIYNPTTNEKAGPFNNESAFNKKLSVHPIRGKEIVVECFVPSNTPSSPKLAISHVSEAYKNVFNIASSEIMKKGFNSSGACNNNASCPEGDFWRDQIQSVALILLGNGTRWCSGCLIGNTDTTDTPYFLTAYHCVDKNDNGEITAAEANDVQLWSFIFNYESETCTPSKDSTLTHSITGSMLKASYYDTDMALLELSSPPPASFNAFYAGWDRSTSAANNAFGVHHPSGDVKKISFEEDNLVSFDDFLWQVPNWDSGVTEGGSSGSPLFNEQGRVVGQLLGGLATCTNLSDSNPNNDWDVYGKFHQSWNLGTNDDEKLSPWLDPTNSNSTFIEGYYYPLSASNNNIHTNEFSLYPVPVTNDRLYVSLNIPIAIEELNMTVYDVLGKIVLTTQVPNKTNGYIIDVTHLETGVYFVKISHGNFSQMKQISISRLK
jgi:lysyl endopeptidase